MDKITLKRHDDRVIAPGAYIVKEKTEVNPSSGIRQRVFD